MRVGAVETCWDDGFYGARLVYGDYLGFWALTSACYGDEIQADIVVVGLVAVYFQTPAPYK